MSPYRFTITFLLGLLASQHGLGQAPVSGESRNDLAKSAAKNAFPFQLASDVDWQEFSTLPPLPATNADEDLEPNDRVGRSVEPQMDSGLTGANDRVNQSNLLVEPIETIRSFSDSRGRLVRYDVPLEDVEVHQTFLARGFQGRLVERDEMAISGQRSITARLSSFLKPTLERTEPTNSRLVRYEVPAQDIEFHANHVALNGTLIEPSSLRLPEVRFFQPKARVFMDLKQENDNEFDLFNDGAILASLDVIELYFPMPLISERFAEFSGRPARLAELGWRVGGTVGLGITTALTNGTNDNGSAPISTVSAGIRYEFPLGRPSRELLESGDRRLDQRTRVGVEFGFQGGMSTRESLDDATDVGLYLGILVDTPWAG